MEDWMMYLSIGEKAKECGVSVATLRRWDKRGLLKPDIITAGGHRRYKNKKKRKLKDGLSLMPESLLMTRKLIWKSKKMSSLPIIPMCCSLISVLGLILISPDLKN